MKTAMVMNFVAAALLAASPADAAPLRRQGQALAPGEPSLLSAGSGSSSSSAVAPSLIGSNGVAPPTPASSSGPAAAQQASSFPPVSASAAPEVQTVLNIILTAANSDASAQGATGLGAAAAAPGTLAAIVQAQQQYMASLTAAAPTEEAAHTVFASVLAYVGTPEGSQWVQQLAATDANFQAADAALSVNRTTECETLQQAYTMQGSQIDPSARDCVCDDTLSYSYCRMLLANSMHVATQDTQSTTTAESLAQFASGFKNGGAIEYGNTPSTNPWQPLTNSGNSNPSLLSRRRQPSLLTSSSVLSNNMTGTPNAAATTGTNGWQITAGTCIGEVVELCVKGTGGSIPAYIGAVLPDGTVTAQKCDNGCDQPVPMAQFYNEAVQEVDQSSLELDVSVCLGIPGLTEVLNKLGISLCIDLLKADYFSLMGPATKISTGLDLWLVKFGAWGLVKDAQSSSSLVCPQDFGAQLAEYMCKNPQLYNQYISEFAAANFCHLQQGQSMAGGSVTLDLLFWQKRWDFQQQVPNRAMPQCQ